jgi:hypothetical protein
VRPRLFFLLAALVLPPTWAVVAHAALDPAHAQADVDAVMRDKQYPFCREPHKPLSLEARRLCSQATSIPSCEGFGAACAELDEPTSPPPSWWNWFRLPPFFGAATQVVVWLLVAVLVVAILIPIARGLSGLMHRGQKIAPEPDAPPVAAPPAVPADVLSLTDEEEILTRADALVAQGNFAAALQLYLLASLRALDKRGVVRIARDRTNGEYVRACTDPGTKPALRDIVREVDRVQFGHEEPTREAVGRAAHRAVAIVRALPVALLVAFLFGCLGCGGLSVPKGRQPGDDPAGNEVLKELLRKQGVVLGGLQTSLATMPLPAAGERTPAVIVDLEMTLLDDETSEHLTSWVKAGGILLLAGSPSTWPHGLEASSETATGSKRITVRRLLARAVPPEPGEEPSADDVETAIYDRSFQSAALSSDRGLSFKSGGERIAWFDDGTSYAAVRTLGTGYVVGVATDELFTNVGLAHAAVFGVILFLAVGTRMGRPRPRPAPRRRAFVEHVEAVGTLYARTRNAAHALAAYARFADERLRARMPRTTGDVATFLASRAGAPLELCQRVWARAAEAKGGAPPQGDELAVLRELTALCGAAMARD